MVIAAPVASDAGLASVSNAAEVVVPLVLQDFHAVSEAYEDFAQLSDDDVRVLTSS